MRMGRKRVFNPANAVQMLARHLAREEVKGRLKQNGIRLRDVPIRELHRLADEHLKANTPQILQEVEARYAPLLARWRDQRRNDRNADPEGRPG